MLSAFLNHLAATYPQEIAQGTFGLMGGMVRVLAAVDGKEPMPSSQVAATLICAAVMPAIGLDILMDWLGLGAKARLLWSFILGGVAIKLWLKAVQRAQEAELPWFPSKKEGDGS
ncbi:MAG: hypothetical protein R3D70_05795 [Rhizobiaceae bacterium]